MRKALFVFVFCLLPMFVFAENDLFNISKKLSVEEQKKLAQELYTQMAALPSNDKTELINLHTQVIENCPDSLRAQESCWKLSNLYLAGMYPPDFQSAKLVLEHLLKQYPDTQLVNEAKNRLLAVYKTVGEFDKVVELYEQMFSLDPQQNSDKIFMARALDYAKALENIGREQDAQNWYRAVIERDGGKNSIEARAATKRLK